LDWSQSEPFRRAPWPGNPSRFTRRPDAKGPL